MIRLVNINKYYTSGNDKIHVLKNLNYIFPDTGLIFILGPSGSGKSTLLNLLGGLDSPDTGEIYIENKALSSFTNREKTNYLNSYLGFVFQEYNILKDLNLKENISLSLEIQGYHKKEIAKKVNQIIKDVELEGLEKRKVNQLSGGQKQRIAIARALVKNPKLIIADEPTGNLDSETGKKVFDLLKKLSTNRLIIVVSHDEESAFQYADDILRIDTAQIDDNGSSLPTTANPKDISSFPSVQAKNQLILKKAKTPMATISKLAFKNLWKKKFRYLLILVISAISLAFLSFAIELNGDKLYQNVYTTIHNNVHYTDIYQYIETNTSDTNDFYSKYQMGTLENGSYDSIKAIAPDLTLHKYENLSIDYTKYQSERENFLYRGKIDTIIRYDETNNYKLFAGRVPQNDAIEILITDYLFEAFKHFGLIDQNATIYDILNRSFDFGFESSLKIVGIVETQYRNWLHLSNQTIYPVNYVIDSYDKAFQGFEYDYLIMNSIIVSDEAYQMINRESASITLNGISTPISYFQPFHDAALKEGTQPINPNEIIVPITKIQDLLQFSHSELELLSADKATLTENQLQEYQIVLDKVLNQSITYLATFQQNGVSEYPYSTIDTTTFTIVGITTEDCFFFSNEFFDTFYHSYQVLREIRNNTQTPFTIDSVYINTNEIQLEENSTIKMYDTETAFSGSLPTSTDEIVIPMSYLKSVYGLSDYEYNIITRYQENQNSLSSYELNGIYKRIMDIVLDSTIEILVYFTNPFYPNTQTSLTKQFKVCGVTSSEHFILGNQDYIKYTNRLGDFIDTEYKESENIIVELPNNPQRALQIFNQLYKDEHHYIIDVFQYKDRIESYDVDPIIEFASTGGLIVFTILTIGIMWSVISIEIVDSKKEIGIMRSIGLTGWKVSLIFFIQMFFINLIAYGISIPIAKYAIESYGTNLTDALGEIQLTMYTMTYRTPIYLAIFVIVITAFSTFLPLLKIISQKIINVINEREN